MPHKELWQGHEDQPAVTQTEANLSHRHSVTQTIHKSHRPTWQSREDQPTVTQTKAALSHR
eukprot:5195557-Karenia_brevis.AAC.1